MSWAIVAVAAVAVVGAGVSAYSAHEQAQSQKHAANYQSMVDANNAKIAEWQRQDALQRGEIEAQQSMQERALLLGRQRAALAASGVDLTQGSALDQLATTEFLGQQDIASIQSNAAREAWGHDITGMNYTSSAGFEQWKAKNANPGKAAGLTAASSLLSSASSYASVYASKGSAKKA